MARSLEFVFEFPPIYGAFDAGNNIVYMFGQMHETSTEDIITHEILHYVLRKRIGKRASLKLDKIHDKIKDDSES